MKIILYFFSVFIVLTVALPLVKKDYWFFRIFDYPRMQKFISVSVLLLIWFTAYYTTFSKPDWIIVGSLCLCFIYLVYIIYPFTPLSKAMIDKVKPGNKPVLKLLVANVYQTNKQYSKLLDLVKERKPDIVFLVETNRKWLYEVKGLREYYPYHIEVPQKNTYGLLFYSKLKIKSHQINNLIDKEIPSIIVDIEFDNETIRIFGLHPTPPVPQENEFSTDRDAEILLIGKMAKKHQGPCLVIGDLNDVAWSYTTELFLKSSGMLDPRRGRGIYSTFNANYPLLRWPLDHYFVSSHFRLVDMKVEKHIGSDHFPISISLVLSGKDDEDKLQPDASEKKLAEEKIDAGIKNRPR